jgi:phosphoribosylanthranilate isomerase
MKRVRVKICGITNEADLEAAVDAGADALGFVVDVPQSPRSLSLNRARDLVGATPPFVQSVVVSVFQTLDHLEALCSYLAPDAVQLAGALPQDSSIYEHVGNTRVITVVAVNDEAVSHETFSAAARFNAVLTDSFVPGVYGGTGMAHNWAVSRAIRERIAPTPLILAGGLTPGNVRAAIETVRPYAVDVSSSVEIRPGVKDHAKMRAFAEAVTEASYELYRLSH